MKVNVEIECSPEEARRFMGLPDVSKANDVYVDAVAKAMKGVGNLDQLQDYAKQLAPMGQFGLKMFQQFMDGNATVNRQVQAEARRPRSFLRFHVMIDTIFALSSGPPPAAIAIIRISGPHAGPALISACGAIAGCAPGNSCACSGIGRARPLIARWYCGSPGPNTATGEDMAELHCHGGRAVVRAVEQFLAGVDGLRPAKPGEFSRRAFANGRIDLSEAEGLADLLSAETELQRVNALALSGGAFSRQVEAWRLTVLLLSAQVEALLDFGDEDDVAELPGDFAAKVEDLIVALN